MQWYLPFSTLLLLHPHPSKPIFSYLQKPIRIRTKDRKIYVCSNYGTCGYISEVKGTRCPNCSNGLNSEAKYVGPKSDVSTNNTVVEVGNDGEGYVKGVLTYSVMDDLTVVPMSTISSIALLNTFKIKDLGLLEEKTASIGFQEGLKILRASLETKTVLADVFLKKNGDSKA